MTTSAPSAAIASRRARGKEDPGPQPAPRRLVGHRAAVVAGAGGDERVDARLFGQRPLDRPGRAEDLERRQPEPARLVLDAQRADAQLGGEVVELVQRRRAVAVERRVEGERLGARRRHSVLARHRIEQSPHNAWSVRRWSTGRLASQPSTLPGAVT
jgi:hypothetical protein